MNNLSQIKSIPREFTVNIQDRGVVTIPLPVREILQTNKITFVIKNEKISLKPVKRSIASHAGKYGMLLDGKGINEVIKTIKEE